MAPRIALASRELYPFVGGGIAPIHTATVGALRDVARVTVVTSSAHREKLEALDPGCRARLFEEIELVFADEPTGPAGGAGFLSWMHAWSAALCAAITDRFRGQPPDLIEFPDYLGEGFVTLQAARTGHPALNGARVAIRTHTSAEMCAVLNGLLDDDLESRVTWEMERYCLREADFLLHSGGDVRGTYERFYADLDLAPEAHVPESFLREPDGPSEPSETEAATLRILYLGRLERRKGVHNLVRALMRTGYADWRLTLLGPDTRTAPLGGSMRHYLELIAGGDPRIVFRDPVPRGEVGPQIAAHDLVAIPSLWECWPNVAREAFLHGRPVLASPVGGLVEMVEEGVSGWLAPGTSPEELLDALEPLLERPELARELGRSNGTREALERVDRPDETRSGYVGLVGRPERPRPRGRSPRSPLVSVVVPYFKMDEYVRATLESVLAQSHRRLEVVIANDGSLRAADEMLFDLAREPGVRVVTQPNSGLGAARNFAISQARGRYILPLDPDNLIEPEYVERCVSALERDRRLAYATTWSQYVDEHGRRLALPANGYTPLGNWSRLIDRQNVAGDGTALVRRRIYDLGFRYRSELTSYEDWFFYRELHHAGHWGDVIPLRLLLYRVRSDSMLRTVGLRNTDLIHQEMNALLREVNVSWVHQSV